MEQPSPELQQAWDRILELDAQVARLTKHVRQLEEEKILEQRHIKQHAHDILKVLG